MANKFARTVGGNWTTDATWSTTSGGAADTVAPTASDDVFLDANSGNVTISATSVGKSLTCTGYTGTLTHNAFQAQISGSVTLVSGMTLTTASSSSIWNILANGTFTSGGKLIGSLTANNSTVTLGDDINFIASKTVTMTASGTGSFNLNGKTVSGNSAINRVLVQSGTLGTAKTITNTTGTFANADFRDITLSSAADLSAITGLSGDCGGNTNITFTTATTQTYTGGTGSWSDVTKWTSRVPLPQDDVLMSGVTGGTITADMPRLGKSIDWTGASGSPTWSLTSTGITNYGSLTLISSMTLTQNQAWTWEGRGAFTLTSAGKQFSSGNANMNVNMVGGSLTLQDAFSLLPSSNSFVVVNNGTLNTNGYSFSISRWSMRDSTATRAVNLSSSTMTLGGTNTGSNVFGADITTGLTWNAGTSTIVLSDTSSTAKTFAGGGLTYNDLKIAGGGAGAIIITGSNTFNRIYTDGGGTKTIQLTSGTTQTLTRTNYTDVMNNGTNIITINAVTGGSAATLSCASGNLFFDYLLLTDITASGGASFFAGEHSTATTNVSGWIFTSGGDAYRSRLIGKGNLTFYKRYQETSSCHADYSAGSQVSTFTVTRNATTPATYVDSSGLVQLQTNTNPRFTWGFYDSTGFVSRPGLIVEGASTNMLKDSYFADTTITTNWRASGGDAAISRDASTIANVYSVGTVTGKLVATLANSLFITAVANKPTLAASTVYTISAILSGSGTVNLYGSTNNGSVGNWSSNITLTSTPKLYTLTITQAGSPFGENVGVGLQNNSTVSCNVHYFQIEALPFASTFIPTTTAALTRNAETLTYPILGNRTAATESMFIKFTLPYNFTATGVYLFSDTDTKRRPMSIDCNANELSFYPNNTDSSGSLVSWNTNDLTIGQSYVFCATASATGNPNATPYLNGVADSVTNVDFTEPAWGTNFFVGARNNSAQQLMGIISSIAIFSDAKSAGDVLIITRFLNEVPIGQQNKGYYPGPQFAAVGLF